MPLMSICHDLSNEPLLAPRADRGGARRTRNVEMLNGAAYRSQFSACDVLELLDLASCSFPLRAKVSPSMW